jgi:hypothetical protein
MSFKCRAYGDNLRIVELRLFSDRTKVLLYRQKNQPRAVGVAVRKELKLTSRIRGTKRNQCSLTGFAGKSSVLRYDFFLNASFRHLFHALFSNAELGGARTSRSAQEHIRAHISTFTIQH